MKNETLSKTNNLQKKNTGKLSHSSGCFHMPAKANIYCTHTIELQFLSLTPYVHKKLIKIKFYFHLLPFTS